LVTVIFEVSKRAIAYTMQRRGIRDFGVDRTGWNRMFKGIYDENKSLIKEIEKGLQEEFAEAERLEEIVEKRWRQHEEDVLA
jgi:tRNA A-37 threonylcarbamoyl transferase component Bud32